MKRRKGFTLVELLVVMVIIGILTVLALPIIRTIRQDNTEKEYSSYQKSIRYAAKLYVDTYHDDLFGNEESGCTIIRYNELSSKDYVKDIDLSGVSCASDDTYVRVVKAGDKYGYAVSIGCGSVDENGHVKVSYRIPKEQIVSSENCDVNAEVIMTFKTDITNPNSLKYKKRSMKMTITSSTGVNSNPIIQYGFSATRTPDVLDGWSKLVINPPSVSSQQKRIKKGETIEVTSNQIETPGNLTGTYYLVLRIDRLLDAFGKNWAKEGVDHYIYLGPYTLDNTKPEFNDSRVISSTDEYHSLEPQLDLKVTDILAPNDQLKMCISYDGDTCLKTLDDIRHYEEYNATKVLDPIKEQLDGSMHKIYVTVADPANNYKTQEFQYELASVITYNGNQNTGGSTAQTICDNNVECTLRENGFVRTGYEFDGWYTKANGGTKYNATTQLTGNITVYAHWKPVVYTITYNLDGGTATNPTTYTIETNTFTLNNPTKTGYTFSGWTGSNGTTKQMTVSIPKGSYGNKEYTANYNINSYTITYVGNTNTGGNTDPTVCNYMEDCSLRDNGFTKTGYNFNGWFTADSGGTQYGSTTQLTNNITVYAQWIDNINPSCLTSKISSGQGGVTVRVTCTDAGSGCREETHDYTGVTQTRYFTVEDNAGNHGQCNVGITSYDCNPYQYACGQYACGQYACGQYAYGQYACGTYRYACGSYACGSHSCGQTCGCNGSAGDDDPTSCFWAGGYWSCRTNYCTTYCTSYCTGTNYCTRYCTNYCTNYCTSYCTAYRTCYS